MNVKVNRSTKLLGVAVISVATFASACGTSTSTSGTDQTATTSHGADQTATTIHAEADSYNSLETLVRSADVVAIGTVSNDQERVLEDGVVPVVYVRVEVEEMLKQPEALTKSDQIVVSVLDWDVTRPDESGTRLSPGSRVLIAGEFISSDSAPIPIPEPGLVSPLGGATGLFDVQDGNQISARSPEILGATDAEADSRLREIVNGDGSADDTREEQNTNEEKTLNFSTDQVKALI